MGNDPNKNGEKSLNNAELIEKNIKDFVRESDLNRLPSFGGEPIFDEPLIGFARGDDDIFSEYKTIIGDFHLTPREAFSSVLKEKGISTDLSAPLTVISFILPITYETRLSLRNETLVPSLRWNHTRFQGQDFIEALSRHMVSSIEALGHKAVAPEIEKCFGYRQNASGMCSTWSQRHMAYAAGLGTFSLNDGFITAKGMAMRCGSVVTDLPLPASERPYANYRYNCLFYRNGSCNLCIQRCPIGALSEKGHDKSKCQDYVFKGTKTELEKMGRAEGYIGYYAACGMCQTKVPCESMIPPDKIRDG